MTLRDPARRRPPIVIWLVVGFVLVSVVICVALGLVAWQKSAQIQVLQGEVQTLKNERQASESLMVALQSTATVTENRLATLEANDPAQQLAELQAAVDSANDTEVATLRDSLVEIQARVDSFQDTLDGLTARIEAMSQMGDVDVASLPSSVRLDVARQRQSHNLSCESSAASMVAQYFGFNISEADFLAALPHDENPYRGFRGNVDGPTGGIEDYGVYAAPIMAILNDKGLRAWPVTGGVVGIKTAIVRGNPVIAWVTYDCLPGVPVEVTIDGEPVTLVPNQHVVVVIGYNDEGIWANDPWDGQEDFYPFDVFENAMAYFGDMAIEISAP